MVKVTIGYHPELTPQAAMEIFQKHFAAKYRVSKIKRVRTRDFIVKKNPLIGVLVGLKQKEDSTSFDFHADAPSAMLAILFWLILALIPALLIYFIVLRPRLKEMEREIKSFIENAPEFK
jgi:hypothetical protein